MIVRCDLSIRRYRFVHQLFTLTVQMTSQKHAHLFTLIEAEASAGRDAGIMNVYKLDSKRPVEAFCDRARAILEIAT